jgi:hypothetical protein
MNNLILFRKATEKLHIGHALLAPAVLAARMGHQIPFLVSAVLGGADISDIVNPSLRLDGSKCAPCDIPFSGNNWHRYQVLTFAISAEFMTSYIMNTTKTAPGEQFISALQKWNTAHFNGKSSINHIVIDESHPAYDTESRHGTESVIRWITEHTPLEFMGTYDHLVIYIPACNNVLLFADHYSTDGSGLFGLMKAAMNEPDVPSPPFPKYQYIPLLTDTMTIESVMRNTYTLWKHPPQITTYGSELVTSSNELHKSEVPKWSRWATYGECILRIFERLEGVRSDLGVVKWGNMADPPIIQPIPQYLHICLSAGIETDCMFGNNRIGGLMVRAERPDPTKSRNDRLDDLMDQFETQCTANVADIISSYDFMRGFDTGKIRKYFSANMFDVTFTSFRFMADANHILKGGGGGFCGSLDSPYMYINSFVTTDRATVTYTTNWW